MNPKYIICKPLGRMLFQLGINFYVFYPFCAFFMDNVHPIGHYVLMSGE